MQARDDAAARTAEETRKREAIQAAIHARRTQKAEPPADPMHLMQLRQSQASSSQGQGLAPGQAAPDHAAAGPGQAAAASLAEDAAVDAAPAAPAAQVDPPAAEPQPGSSSAGAVDEPAPEEAANPRAPAAAEAAPAGLPAVAATALDSQQLPTGDERVQQTAAAKVELADTEAELSVERPGLAASVAVEVAPADAVAGASGAVEPTALRQEELQEEEAARQQREQQHTGQCQEQQEDEAEQQQPEQQQPEQQQPEQQQPQQPQQQGQLSAAGSAAQLVQLVVGEAAGTAGEQAAATCPQQPPQLTVDAAVTSEQEPATPPEHAAQAAADSAAAGGSMPPTPPGLLAAVMHLADGWGSMFSGMAAAITAPGAEAAATNRSQQEAITPAVTAPLQGGTTEPASGVAAAAGELASPPQSPSPHPLQQQQAATEQQSPSFEQQNGWDSPGGSLDGLLAVTAQSDLPQSSAGITTVAASRAHRQLDEFLTPLPQPDWLQGEQGEEGVASSGKFESGSSSAQLEPMGASSAAKPL